MQKMSNNYCNLTPRGLGRIFNFGALLVIIHRLCHQHWAWQVCLSSLVWPIFSYLSNVCLYHVLFGLNSVLTIIVLFPIFRSYSNVCFLKQFGHSLHQWLVNQIFFTWYIPRIVNGQYHFTPKSSIQIQNEYDQKVGFHYHKDQNLFQFCSETSK